MNNWYKNTYNISKKTAFAQGLKDGIPIALGYFAVAFSLGIIAKVAGLTPFQGFLSSALNRASAGEYAIYTLKKLSLLVKLQKTKKEVRTFWMIWRYWSFFGKGPKKR